MRIVDQIRFGPFGTAYHRALVDDTFQLSLEDFLERNLLPQCDAPIHGADGALTATFDDEQFCGPTSLVRNIFSLELDLFGEAGDSKLKADVVYDVQRQSFAARTGHDYHFYLWTPSRRQQRATELAAIENLVTSTRQGCVDQQTCPICGGNIAVIDDSLTFDVRCRGDHCFKHNYHKDGKGRPVHGHFFVKHPSKRVGPS